MKGSQSLIAYVFLERSVLENRLDNTAAAQMSGETWLNDPGEKKKENFKTNIDHSVINAISWLSRALKLKNFVWIIYI